MSSNLPTRLLLIFLPLALAGCGGGAPGAHEHAAGEEHQHPSRPVAASAEPAAPATTAQTSPASGEAQALWSCPMHPEVTSSEPGRCPECGMFLTRPDADHGHEHAEGDGHDHDGHGHDHGGHDHGDHGHEH